MYVGPLGTCILITIKAKILAKCLGLMPPGSWYADTFQTALNSIEQVSAFADLRLLAKA